jgi:hypothetical protein
MGEREGVCLCVCVHLPPKLDTVVTETPDQASCHVTHRSSGRQNKISKDAAAHRQDAAHGLPGAARQGGLEIVPIALKLQNTGASQGRAGMPLKQ